MKSLFFVATIVVALIAVFVLASENELERRKKPTKGPKVNIEYCMGTRTCKKNCRLIGSEAIGVCNKARFGRAGASKSFCTPAAHSSSCFYITEYKAKTNNSSPATACNEANIDRRNYKQCDQCVRSPFGFFGYEKITGCSNSSITYYRRCDSTCTNCTRVHKIPVNKCLPLKPKNPPHRHHHGNHSTHHHMFNLANRYIVAETPSTCPGKIVSFYYNNTGCVGRPNKVFQKFQKVCYSKFGGSHYATCSLKDE